MSEAELLLLTLEVEAAAARNAALSRRVEELQLTLLSTTRALRDAEQTRTTGDESLERRGAAAMPHAGGTRGGIEKGDAVPVANIRSAAASDEDITLALVNLDDALFDIAEIMSVLYSDETIAGDSSRNVSARRRILVSGELSLVELTRSFLSQVKDVKAACITRLGTCDARIKALADELQATHSRLAQRESDWQVEKSALNRRILELEAQVGLRAPETVMPVDSQDILRQCKLSNDALRLENVALRDALAKLQKDAILGC